MNLYDELLDKKEKIAVVGLGYVGMPIAVAFSKKVNVIGFDVNERKINLYKSGIDPTKEIGDEGVKNCSVDFTSDENKLKEAKFFIVAVPTPIKEDKSPDLFPLEASSTIVGRNLTKGSIVVYESTVYPGVTEDFCLPILEKESGLKYGVDFKLGYSPERINPGDKVHTLETIVKIVSGMDEESLDIIAKVYELVVEAGVYRAESIKVAEAAKIIENSQRDVNIAFMNELSIIFDKIGIDTQSVIEAAATKWNFLKFNPGLVGGHCIGVDPYYLTYRAEQLGYTSRLILSARKINDDMGKHISQIAIKKLIQLDKIVKQSKVGILGFTFKEDCPDVRNSKVVDIVNGLKEYGITPIITDPVADSKEIEEEYKVTVLPDDEIRNLDVVIVAVSHSQYREFSVSDIDKYFKKMSNQNKLIIDVKGILDKEELEKRNYCYWRL